MKLTFEVSPSPTNSSGVMILGRLDGVVELDDERVEFAIRATIITN